LERGSSRSVVGIEGGGGSDFGTWRGDGSEVRGCGRVGLGVGAWDSSGGRGGGGRGTAVGVERVEVGVSFRGSTASSLLRVARELIVDLVVLTMLLLPGVTIVESTVLVRATRTVEGESVGVHVALREVGRVGDGRLSWGEGSEVALTDGVVVVRVVDAWKVLSESSSIVELIVGRNAEIVRSEASESSLSGETSEKSWVESSDTCERDKKDD